MADVMPLPQNTDEFKEWCKAALNLDLETEQVTSIDIHIDYHSLPTVTITRFVDGEEAITTLPLEIEHD